MKADLIFEVWKPVPGYEWLYDVSNFGRVRSLNYNHTGKTKLLNLKKERNGYLRVHLKVNNRNYFLLVHRLVYETFIGQITEGMQINHINEIKTDNSVWNLNLMTPKENTNYGNCIKRRVVKLSKIVYQYTLDGILVHVWPSAQEAGRNGFSQSAVSNCCLGKRKSHKGFLWSYTPLN